MTAKEYLSQIFKLDQKINSKLAQVSTLKELATKPTGSVRAGRVSGTDERCPMENAVVKLIDLNHEIDADIDCLVDLKKEIIGVISSLREPACRMILELRYLQFKQWNEIAKVMKCNCNEVHNIHSRALRAIGLSASNPVRSIERGGA